MDALYPMCIFTFINHKNRPFMQINMRTKPMDGMDWLWHARVALHRFFQHVDEV